MRREFETLRAYSGAFTAHCGHDVFADAHYIVRKDPAPHRVYCSPACAEADDEIDITVRIHAESLPELVAGPLVYRFGLVDKGDGVYHVRAQYPADDDVGGRALIRAAYELGSRARAAALPDEEPWFPELPEPDAAMERAMESVRIRLGWNGTPSE